MGEWVGGSVGRWVCWLMGRGVGGGWVRGWMGGLVGGGGFVGVWVR